MLLFGTLFLHSTFKVLDKKISLLFLIMTYVWNEHLENWKILCIFWEQTWATRYIQTEHAWTNKCWWLFQYKLPAGSLPNTVCGQWQEWKKNRMKSMKINKLAKPKTRKGGLGKKWAPRWIDNLQRQFRQKQGQWKTIPRWIENPKGWSRQKWDDERTTIMKTNKSKHAKSIDHRCDVKHPTAAVLSRFSLSTSL